MDGGRNMRSLYEFQRIGKVFLMMLAPSTLSRLGASCPGKTPHFFRIKEALVWKKKEREKSEKKKINENKNNNNEIRKSCTVKNRKLLCSFYSGNSLSISFGSTNFNTLKCLSISSRQSAAPQRVFTPTTALFTPL